MEALKNFDVKELLRRQEMLDKKFDEKETVRKRNLQRIRIAYYTELGELFQELKGEWNYWKNTTKPFNKNKVLEELSDCLHFLLSYLNRLETNVIFTENDIFYLLEIERKHNVYIEDILIELYKYLDREYYKYIIINILILVERIGSTIEEFLEVHHRVWERNMGERTRVDY